MPCQGDQTLLFSGFVSLTPKFSNRPQSHRVGYRVSSRGTTPLQIIETQFLISQSVIFVSCHTSIPLLLLYLRDSGPCLIILLEIECVSCHVHGSLGNHGRPTCTNCIVTLFYRIRTIINL